MRTDETGKLHFDDIDEAIEYGKKTGNSKYEYIVCYIKNKEGKDQKTILCQTNLVYEDEIWSAAYEAYKHLGNLLYDELPDDFGIDEASDIRDFVTELFEKTEDVRLEFVNDEY